MPLISSFMVHRRDPRRHQTITISAPPLLSGEIRIRVNRFGLSSNNITYAFLGGASPYPYLNFFPVPEHAEWSQPPVWGLGTVDEIRDANSTLRKGDRVYGFFPTATQCTLRPTRDTQIGFYVDRSHLPKEFEFYNHYSLSGKDPFLPVAGEDWTIVFRPVFLTGLLLADYLRQLDSNQGNAVIISSGSSKTAYGLAKALSQNPSFPVIGLTSRGNLQFSKRLGVYDRVVPYDEISSLPADRGAIYVDIAGNEEVRESAARQLGNQLKRIVSVGMTHCNGVASYGASNRFEGKTEVFFAPGWSTARQTELGFTQWFNTLLSGWKRQVEGVDKHFQMKHKIEKGDVATVYSSLINGTSKPDDSYVLSTSALESINGPESIPPFGDFSRGEVQFVIDKSVGYIRLNRPEARNSTTSEIARDTHDALVQYQHNPQVKTVVFESTTPNMFCSGGDIRTVRKAILEGNQVKATATLALGYSLNYRIHTFPKPIIARVQGYAWGGGAAFACISHACEAAENVVLGMPETKAGFYPDAGAAYFLQRRTPPSIALYLALTGAPFTVKQAAQLGLISTNLEEPKVDTDSLQFLPPEMVEAFSQPTLSGLFQSLRSISSEPVKSQAQKCLKDLQLKSPTSVAVTFELMKRCRGCGLKEVIEITFIVSSNFSNHPDFLEGIRAVMIDKDNKPRWAPAPSQAEIADFFVSKVKEGIFDCSTQEWYTKYLSFPNGSLKSKL